MTRGQSQSGSGPPGGTGILTVSINRRAGEWEVNDAGTANGREFDVRLATDDLRELSRRGDDPLPEHRTRIEAALRRLGFMSWRGIKDARLADGRRFDVRLAADDLRELSRKVE